MRESIQRKISNLYHNEAVDDFTLDEAAELQSLLQTNEITYYDLFQVSQFFFQDELVQLKRKYHQLALHFHPDKISGEATLVPIYTEIFKCIKAGYETLSDDQKRNRYNAELLRPRPRSERVSRDDSGDGVSFELFLRHWRLIHSLACDVSVYHERACEADKTTLPARTNTIAGNCANTLIDAIREVNRMLILLTKNVTTDFQLQQLSQLLVIKTVGKHIWVRVDDIQKNVLQLLLEAYCHNTNLYHSAKESDIDLPFKGVNCDAFFNEVGSPPGVAPAFKRNIVNPLIQLHHDIFKLIKSIISKCSDDELMRLLMPSIIAGAQFESDAVIQQQLQVVQAIRQLSMGQILDERRANELLVTTIKIFDHNVVYLFYDLLDGIRLNEIEIARALLDAASAGNFNPILRCHNFPMTVLYEVAKQASNPVILNKILEWPGRCDDTLRQVIIANMCLYPHPVTVGFFSNSRNMNSTLPIRLALECLQYRFPKYYRDYSGFLSLDHYISNMQNDFDKWEASDTLKRLDYARESFREAKNPHFGLLKALSNLREQITAGCRPIDINEIMRYFAESRPVSLFSCF